MKMKKKTKMRNTLQRLVQMIGSITHMVTVNGMQAILDSSVSYPNPMKNGTTNGITVICLDLNGTAQITTAN